MRRFRSIAPLALLLACACARDDALAVPEPRLVDVPAAAGAAQPFAAVGVVAAGGADAAHVVLVSWLEPSQAGHALRHAAWDGASWTAPRPIAEGADWFVNWADFPALVQAGDVLAAHWLQRSGPGRYAYDVLLTTSTDFGATWSPPMRPHRDGTETEHGFVSLFPHGGAVGVVWLDGRAFVDAAGHEHEGGANEMQLRFTTVGTDGGPAVETLLDDRVCDCCQTAVAVTGRGPVVAYRDRSPDEVRDISITRLVDGAWTQPVPLHRDGWVIHGCPVNGPAADADGDDVVVAWFTAASDSARVHAAFSADAGASFGPPIAIDDGAPLGRVDVLMLGGGRAFVAWLEQVGEATELRGRVVARDGSRGAARSLAATSAQRASGFPRMARRGSEVLLVWTEPGGAGEASRVRAASLRFDASR